MKAKPRVLVSMCLLGIECRYDGRGNSCGRLNRLMQLAELIPACPEIMGGLTTPRAPSERAGERVCAKDGSDVTAQFHRGAEQAVRLAQIFDVKYALMKSRSPSCGSGMIYDGTFTGNRIPGDGVTVEKLKAAGIPVYSEEQIDQLIEILEGEEQ